MNKLDELFKEKLSDYTVAPSAGAWLKVEASLSKKNKAVVWLRWAAMFLLGGLLLGTLWFQRQDDSLPLAKEKPPVQQKDEVESQKSTAPAMAEQKTETKNVVGKKKVNTLPQLPPQQESLAKEEVAQIIEEQPPMPGQSVETQVIEVTKATLPASKGIVLTYTLGPVELLTEAAAAQEIEVAAGKKDKSLKRMVEFARIVKNSDPMGEIRVMKEDLFALDLKKKTTSKNH